MEFQLFFFSPVTGAVVCLLLSKAWFSYFDYSIIYLKKLNKIAEKIRGIKTYETMDYVGGLKIVDIDKAASGSSIRKL